MNPRALRGLIAAATTPLTPALKAALARRTGEAGWRRVRPPLVALAPEEGESLWQELVREGLDQ